MTEETGSEAKAESRRKALKRLGLAVGAAYLAPTVTRLDRSAAGTLPSPGCPAGRPGCGPTIAPTG